MNGSKVGNLLGEPVGGNLQDGPQWRVTAALGFALWQQVTSTNAYQC